MPLSGAVQEWSCPAPAVDVSRLLRVHKYTDPSKVRPVIVAAAKQAADEAYSLSAPTARYVIVEIESLKNGILTLVGGHQFECPAFDQHLENCQHLLAFVMTIGGQLDAKTLSLVEDVFEPLDALFLETAGWLTIEAATRKLATKLRADAARSGWATSLRMGPGYEYKLHANGERVRWNLVQQQVLFQLFGDAPLPVELLSSCAMFPKMSRSGIYGLARKK
jgi:hypothetical protein